MSPLSNHRFTSSRLWLLALLCLSLGGCSLKVTYPFMDWWLSWTVRDYVSLDRTQRQQLESRLDQFHHWHQQTQLPQYARFVEQLSEDIEQPVSTDQLHQITSELQQHWLNSLDYLIDDIDQLFVSLDQHQWQNFLGKLEETQSEYSQPFLSKNIAERQKLRQKRFIKGAKRWIGKLTPSQKELVIQWSHELKPMAELSMQRQADWSVSATELFQQRHKMKTPERQRRLRKLIINDSESWPLEAQQSLAHNQQVSYQLLIDLHQMLNMKQQKRIQDKLKNYHADFHYLASKVPSLALQ
ncbi:MAG: DUF6279 family lipoprotein [Cellvibrionaceae bacterium]